MLQDESLVCDVRLLGNPCLRLSRARVHALSPADAALLAVLAIDGPSARQRLAELLWPAGDARSGNLNLRQRIFRLKRIVGADLIRGDRSIEIDPRWPIDLVRASRGDGLPEAVPAGELLGSHSFEGALADWVEHARNTWRARRRDLLAERAQALEAAGGIAAALALAERIAADEPAAEHAHRRVMRLHYLRGDRAAALAAFERCKFVLYGSLGEPPGQETLDLLALIESSAAPANPVATPPTPSLIRPPRLVARDQELQAIDAAWAQRRVAVLIGEPGVGKTRLMQAVAAPKACWVAAARSDSALAYSSLTRVLQGLLVQVAPEALPAWAAHELARLLPEWGSAPTAALDAGRLRAAAQSVLAAAAQVGLPGLVIDDVHLVDAPSLEVLLSLAESPPGRALRWLMAARPAETPTDFSAWLQDSESAPAQAVVVLPFREQDLETFIASLALPGIDVQRWTQVLHRHTGGNPLFVIETLLAYRALGAMPALPPPQQPASASLGLLIEARLRRLSTPALRLAQLAALADAEFSVALATRVLGVAALDLSERWRELEQAAVFTEMAFSHELVREGVLRSVPVPIAAELHAQIAAAAVALGAPAHRIAGHWQAAATWLPAARQYRAAAADLFDKGRRHEEAEMLDQAARCFKAAGCAGECFEALCDRAGALLQFAPAAEVDAALAALESLADSDTRRAVAAVVRAEAQIVAGNFDAVVTRMPQAIDTLLAADSIEAALLAARRLSVALVNLGRPREAAETLESRLAELERLPVERARYEYLGELGTVLERCNRRSDGERHQRRCIELATRASDMATAATALVNLGINRLYWGDLHAACEATEQGLRLRALHDPVAGLAAAMEMTLGGMCRDLGRYEHAIRCLEHALEVFEEGGNGLWTLNTRLHLGLLWLQLGQWARAQRLLEMPPGADAPPFLCARRLGSLAMLRRLRGRAEPALLGEALALLASADRVDVRLALQLERCHSLEAADAAEAGVLCQSLVAEAESCELMGHAVAGRILWARALLNTQRFDAAAREVASAVARWPSVAPTGFYRPQGWLMAGEVLEALGDGRAARSAYEQGRVWVASALEQLPLVFHRSFLEGNAVNQSLHAKP